MITYAVTGDGRLARQALEAFNDSRIPEGITRSRYPSSLPQNIPTFSLLWIDMLHDWWMYQPDPEPILESLEGTRGVLRWFAQYQRPDGLLAKTPWWSIHRLGPGQAGNPHLLGQSASPASPPSNTSAPSNKPPISSRPSATRTSPSSTAIAPPAYAAAS